VWVIWKQPISFTLGANSIYIHDELSGIRLKFAQCGYATNLCVMSIRRVRTPSSTSSRDSRGASSSIHLIVSVSFMINVIGSAWAKLSREVLGFLCSLYIN